MKNIRPLWVLLSNRDAKIGKSKLIERKKWTFNKRNGGVDGTLL